MGNQLNHDLVSKCSPGKMLNLDFNIFFFTIGEAFIKGVFQFSPGGHFGETWCASCPFRKVIRASWFFQISVQINVSFTIKMKKGF